MNHYANVNDSLRQSWKRQKPVRNYSSYTDSEPEGSAVVSLNGGQIIMNNMARSRAPLPGFSSFVWSPHHSISTVSFCSRFHCKYHSLFSISLNIRHFAILLCKMLSLSYSCRVLMTYNNWNFPLFEHGLICLLKRISYHLSPKSSFF